jgi:D-lyxose ketol-isomerase
VKLVTLVAGDRVRFELAWAEGDKTLSQKSVRVQVDGVWHDLPANGELFLRAGETILLPSELSHIIQVMPGDSDVILQETSTANNDRKDNIFPFIAPTSSPIEEDSKPRYQLLDEQHDLSGSKT